jgi:hypothetical protein
MSGRYVLNAVGEPVVEPDLFAWARWFERGDEVRRVAETVVGNARVSTVFLGLDHNFSRSGPPLLFETMVFGGDHDEYCDRYATRAEAEAGHAAAVEMVKAGKTE